MDITQINQLDELLAFLSLTSPDCLPDQNRKLNVPTPSLPDHALNVQIAQNSLIEQSYADQKVIDYRNAHMPESEFWMVKPPEPVVPQSPFHFCRLILHHLGFLLFDRKDTFFEMENSARFLRSLTQLDKTCGRELMKIGVIYVKEGQDDQKIILTNETKSPLYREFVRGLGWTIDVASHRGYLGGLDPKLTTGTHSPYYANSIMEVIFHEITSMPTNPADDQQIHKKRHVGNDIVHIVYSEHSRDYSPQTITSQFNDAHIVIYPLPNGLYRIQIFRKPTVQMFGPLLHGMCVDKRMLTTLVRQTAVNANRYVRLNTEGYTRPYPTRRRAIEEAVQRYKIQKRFPEVLSGIIIQPSKGTISVEGGSLSKVPSSLKESPPS